MSMRQESLGTRPASLTVVRAAQERERLSQIAEDHSRKLAEPSEAARLTALFAAGRLDGTHAAKLAALQVTAVTRPETAACDACLPSRLPANAAAVRQCAGHAAWSG